MARPLKESLDYFPLDIDFDQDDKLVVPLAKFGMEGLGIIVKLMGEVYRNGYFYPWTEREQYVFSNRVNVDINLVTDIVNECIKWGFFNKRVYESHEVLTSKGFQKRYIEAAKRRKTITFVEDYILIDPNEECSNVSHNITVVNANEKVVNVYINPDKCNNQSAQTPQSKVKESKVKEIESKEDIEPIVASDECDLSFQEFWKTYPTKGSNKKMSLQKWATLWKNKKIVLKEVLDGVNRYVTYQNHNGYKICAAQVFLNQERWKDEWVIEEGQRGGFERTEPFSRGQTTTGQYNANGSNYSSSNGKPVTDPRNAPEVGGRPQVGGDQKAPSKYDQFVRR